MTAINWIVSIWMTILLVSLVVALATLNFAAVGGLLLFIGIAMPNFKKRKRQSQVADK